MRRRPVSSFAALGLAALFALTAALPASAAAGEWSIPVTLSEVGQNAEAPQLVTDGTTITAIWIRSDGINYRVQVASSVDGGSTWSTPATLSEAGHAAIEPQVVTDGTTITATWRRYDGSGWRVQVSSSVDGGLTWGAPASLSEAGGDAFDPLVVTDGTTITASWSRFDGSNTRVQVSSSVDGGLTWGTPVTVSEAGQNAAGPQVVTDGTVLTASWSRFDGSNTRVQVSSSVDGGLSWSVPVTVSEAGRPALHARVVTDGTTITVAWVRFDGIHDLVQVSSSVDGGLSWSVPVTASEAGQNAFTPQVVTDGTTLTATWWRFDGSNARAQVSSSVDGGLTWSTPLTLSEANQDAYGPRVVTDGTTITATWTQYNGSVYWVQVSSSVDGGLTWGAPVNLSEAGGDAFDPQVVTDGTMVTAAWSRDDGSSTRVQVASLVTAVDEPAVPEPTVPEPTVPELAATGAHEALAVSLLAGGLLLTGGALVAVRARGRRTA